MKINNKDELYKFLKLNINDVGSFALATYDNHTVPIWITRYKDFDKDGDWFLEAPCELHEFEFKDQSEKHIRKYAKSLYKRRCVKEGIQYIKSMIRGEWLYDIDCPQISPFLPYNIDDLTLVSEQYCLEWILNNR